MSLPRALAAIAFGLWLLAWASHYWVYRVGAPRLAGWLPPLFTVMAAFATSVAFVALLLS